MVIGYIWLLCGRSATSYALHASQFARYTVTAESDAKSRPLSLSRRSFRVLSSTPHTSMSITAPYTVFASWMEIAFTHTGVSKSATHSTCVLLTVTRGLLADTSAGGAVVAKPFLNVKAEGVLAMTLS